MTASRLNGAPDLASAAMELAQDIGWPVFPCRPRDKTPLIARAAGGSGCLDATTHAEQVGLWWVHSPAANIGVATGGRMGLCVIDVDGPQGEESLASFGPIPATVEAVTRKGRHLYFRAVFGDAINSVGLLGPQVDTRGEGGYIIAPPSLHPSGFRYAWRANHSPTDLPLAELPATVRKAMNRAAEIKSARVASRLNDVRGDRSDLMRLRRWLEEVPSGLRAGEGRNAMAFRIAARALETLCLNDAQRLVHAWNSGNVQPLDQHEVQQIVHSAQRYARRHAA